TVPDDLAELPAIVGGEEMDFKYKDCKKEMDMVNKAFIQTMIEGDSNGRGFQYPIPTYSITRDFDWSDTENNRLLFEMTAKYGTPYFSNYINSDMQPSDVRSMCCRLRLDLRELRKKTGGFFGSGESTGSVGVVTINMPRIAYLSANRDEFYARLNHMMDIAARSLKVKRDVITKLLDEGLYPYTKRYLGTFDNHFSTIGLIGMSEVGLNANWLRADMSSEKTQEFTKEVLNHMRNRLSDYQEQYGDLYNLEATPAESTTYRLAKHDKKRWPAIKTAGKQGDTPYYTNSSHLPVDYTTDIFDALDVQDELQTLYTSGTVFHAFLGEKLPDWKAAAALVRKIAEIYKLPYYTLSPTYSICREH
ncbi:MAG: ribonucleoside triphosphate reductase, partial [Acetatifactor sp.]|nr:ribonucleoside triphosphate reductase [Acetatifactor sp.]